jgi:hypothetical protein
LQRVPIPCSWLCSPPPVAEIRTAVSAAKAISKDAPRMLKESVEAFPETFHGE